MRLRHIPGSEEAVGENPYVLSEPWSYRGRFSELFPDPGPVKLEIGCGKGRFITKLSQNEPSANYIGMERYSSVLLYALRKAEDADLKNLLFLCNDARELENIFAPGEVDIIYLNFPDPWPKERHAKRRLTSPGYLKIYRNILKEDGYLEFKTDNRQLFDYSLDALEESGWKIIAQSYDIYSDKGTLFDGNIQTEYEIKFSELGEPICKLKALPKMADVTKEGGNNNGDEF